MTRTARRLDPVRLALPRGRNLLRWGLVAALLALAAGILYSGPQSCPTPPTASGRAEGAGSGAGLDTTAAPSAPAVDWPTAAPDADPAVAGVPAAAVPPGLAAVTVRLADPAIAAVLRPGARVDLVQAGPASGAIMTAVVLATVPGLAFDDPSAAAIFVAVPRDAATRLVNTGVDTTFRVIVRSM